MNLIRRRNNMYIARIKIWRAQQITQTRIQRWMICLGQWLVKKATINWDIIPCPKFKKSFQPLVNKVMKELNADNFEHYGPFGLNCENSYYWYKGFYKKKKDRDPEPKIVGSLHFVSRGAGWHIRNYGKKVRDYPENSIAEMNGDNYEVIPIDKNMTWKRLMTLIKKRK